MTTKTNNNLNNPHNRNLGNLPIWDLSDLYESIESKKIGSDLEFVATKAKEFAKNYEGKIFSLNRNSISTAEMILLLEKLVTL